MVVYFTHSSNYIVNVWNKLLEIQAYHTKMIHLESVHRLAKLDEVEKPPRFNIFSIILLPFMENMITVAQFPFLLPQITYTFYVGSTT